MAVTSGSSSRPAKKAKAELVRHDSGQSSSRNTPISSTEGDYEDEDEEEDEEDDDVEEEGEEEEEEDISAADNNVRFDEQFLAQLLAFDSSLAGQTIANGTLPPSQASRSQHEPGSGSQADISKHASAQQNAFSSINETRQTPSNTSVLPFSAPTPSNEFYDGAINFLTEVLGSSTPSFWTGDTNLAQSAGGVNWVNQGSTPAASVGPMDFAASDLHAAKSEFKNLQPLIGNLIARLKGLPIQEGQHIGQTLEDDLVILLQSLMAHRQAQQNRQAQEQLDQSLNMLNHAPVNTTSNELAQSSSSAAAMNALQPNGNSTQTYPSAPGFSIVDFDFGDDDDDPDFVPNNVNLDFANSQDFADALAQVSAAPIASLPNGNIEGDTSNNGLHVDDASWQQVMNALQPQNDALSGSKETSFPSPWDDNDTSRRTRSATRNIEIHDGGGDNTTLEPRRTGSPTFESVRSQSRGEDHEKGGSNDTDHDEPNGPGEKKRGRKARPKEEALIRRRESNRECSRRSRLRRKEEEEEIRREFIRMQQLKDADKGTESSRDGGMDAVKLPAALRKKKLGRPLGSKSFAHREGSEGTGQGENDEKVADLKADNRMLRAEMQRLIEENARLRAQMLRVQEEGSVGISSAGRTRVSQDNTRHDRYQRRDRRYDDEDSDSGDAEGFFNGRQAARMLPYDPIKSFQPPISSSRHSLTARPDNTGAKRKRNDSSVQEPSPSIEQLLRGLAAYQQGAPSTAMPENYPVPRLHQRRSQVG